MFNFFPPLQPEILGHEILYNTTFLRKLKSSKLKMRKIWEFAISFLIRMKDQVWFEGVMLVIRSGISFSY